MGNNLTYLNISDCMSIAAIEGLKSNPNPNPKVGAALFDVNGNLKAKSHHEKKGFEHAEISLINNSNIKKDDVLYVTLEPCFHDDTSPSCANELLKTEIKNIVIGDLDVDIRTSGKSINMLKNAGINVLKEKGVNDLINPYYKNNKDVPFVTYIGKIGISNNNFIFDEDSESKYITNDIAIDISHILRATCDAVLIGKNTFKIDKPILNVRQSELIESNNKPLKFVWWGSKVPESIKKNEKYTDFIFIENRDIEDLDKKLLEYNCRAVLVEGGKYTHEKLFKEHKYNIFYEFRSSNIVKNGLVMDYLNDEIFRNEYKQENKFTLRYNELITYTRK